MSFLVVRMGDGAAFHRSVLPRVLHDEVDYHQQKYYVEDLIDEEQQALTRVGGL